MDKTSAYDSHSSVFRSCIFNMKIFLLLLLTSCSLGKQIPEAQNDPDLAQFASLLSGRFSNAAQAAGDTAFFHISLVMTPIWPERRDGVWLYVEQAMASKPDKPYRQRVYKLTHPSKNLYRSDIYTVKNAKEFAGLQSDRNKKQQLTPDSIELKDGCEVILRNRKGTYRGGTSGKNCSSDLRGASYATSDITLKEGELFSWDRGFDAAGKQVWGSTKGGYIFVKER